MAKVYRVVVRTDKGALVESVPIKAIDEFQVLGVIQKTLPPDYTVVKVSEIGK